MNKFDALAKRGLRPVAAQQAQANRAEQLTTGCTAFDERLRGGIPSGSLHEIFSVRSDDVASALAFAVMLTLRLVDSGQPMLWIAEERIRLLGGRLYPSGLAALGGNPDSMVLVETRNAKDALRASADALRSAATAAVILSVHGNAPTVDLTATRRLMLAASQSGVLALLLRNNTEPAPSAAYSRWHIASAPSQPLAAKAPGFPTFDVALTRHRGGIAPFAMRLEWNHETRSFRDSPLSGGLSAAVASGAAGAPERQSA